MLTYERKIPLDLNCGITVFMKVLGAKWKPCIIEAIYRGYRRPTEIHQAIKEATPRVLDMQLRELEAIGAVEKQVQPGFPLRADYTLTNLGLSLVPIIQSMDKWGNQYGEQVKDVTANVGAYTE
ncbi:MAG TPA: helix-turn-helix domain-containing protein [Chitinophaga sp.]|uniref:winged helix-turn-helix transcriptional regulator n=1 Tax=Chitinophaga sp. TaxID=1869181 RepID=UPI002CD32771|nr:helix-turn-helix domain-containing protein [Chitinophaga sp.]HVI47311.1 helix-turn-helix domain-containing protein [Chitinophaga sp.]